MQQKIKQWELESIHEESGLADHRTMSRKGERLQRPFQGDWRKWKNKFIHLKSKFTIKSKIL